MGFKMYALKTLKNRLKILVPLKAPLNYTIFYPEVYQRNSKYYFFFRFNFKTKTS